MRILQICQAFPAGGGIQRHIIDLSDWLRAKGHDVFFAGSPGEWLNEDIDRGFFSLDLNGVVEEGGSKLVRISRAIHCAVRLRRILRRNRIELVHAHDTAPVIVTRLASLGMGTRIVLSYHGSTPERVPQVGLVGRLTAQRIITPSYRTAKDLQERGGISKSKIQVIGLGIKPPAPIENHVVSRRREELLGADGKFLIVTLARLAPQKSIDTLIKVVQRVKEQRRDIRFVVVGDGPQRQQVGVWASEAGVDSHLQFVGQTDQPYLYLKAADLFLLTSVWEALPISIAEALRAGLPVVTTHTGGVKELVDPTIGRVVSIGDIDALAKSVLEICGNDELRREMSENALRLSTEDRFSPAHVHRLFEETYANMLDVTLPPEVVAANK